MVYVESGLRAASVQAHGPGHRNEDVDPADVQALDEMSPEQCITNGFGAILFLRVVRELVGLPGPGDPPWGCHFDAHGPGVLQGVVMVSRPRRFPGIDGGSGWGADLEPSPRERDLRKEFGQEEGSGIHVVEIEDRTPRFHPREKPTRSLGPTQLAPCLRGCDIPGMNYSENVIKLQPSATIAVSTLAKKLAAEGRDIINLGAGEPDFATPSWVAAKGVEAIEAGDTRYTPVAGTPALRSAIADYMAGGTAYAPDPTRVMVTAGAKQALFNAAFCLFGPGDDVLIGAPYWTSYPEIVTLARARPVPVTGDEHRGFKLSPDDLEAAYSPSVKGLIISSPSNPSGAVYSSEELAALAEWCKARNVVLISDEIYREIYFGDEGVRAPGVLDLDAAALGTTVVVNGLSKSFAMTGWRIGFCWADPDLTKKMTSLQSHVSSNPSTPSQAAALEALSDPERAAADRKEMVTVFRRRRDLVTGLFDELAPRCGYVRPEGAFYLYFRVDSRFDDALKTSADVCTALLEEVGVAVVPGSAFGDDRFARMSIASSDQELEDGVRRMASILGA